jgi:hypothetical protein
MARALAVACLSAAFGGYATAQSAVHAPMARPPLTHHADFSGIWTRGDNHDMPMRGKLPYNKEWQKKFDAIEARAKQGGHPVDGTLRCLTPGMPRFLLFVYPIEVLMTPGQVTLLAEYFNETRRIFTDGRSHPSGDDLEPTFRGHSIGHWEGKTLVVDTVGIRGDTLFSSDGQPHSDQLHVIERIQLVGPNQLRWTVTLEDPIAFAKPFTFSQMLQRAPATDEIREYVCEENNAQTFGLDQPGH